GTNQPAGRARQDTAPGRQGDAKRRRAAPPPPGLARDPTGEPPTRPTQRRNKGRKGKARGKASLEGPNNQKKHENFSFRAEGVEFEPTLRFPVNTLSKRAPSATRPPLRTALAP